MTERTKGLAIYPSKTNYFLNTRCIPYGDEGLADEWGEHANGCGLRISSSKMKSKCIEINCLPSTLSPQLEQSFKGSAGRRPACFTEAIYPNMSSVEMEEIRQAAAISSIFPRTAITELHANRPLGLGSSENPNSCCFPCKLPHTLFLTCLIMIIWFALYCCRI